MAAKTLLNVHVVETSEIEFKLKSLTCTKICVYFTAICQLTMQTSASVTAQNSSS